jgi:hypothetical protein
MTAFDHRLTFAALNLADAKRPIARHEQLQADATAERVRPVAT